MNIEVLTSAEKFLSLMERVGTADRRGIDYWSYKFDMDGKIHVLDASKVIGETDEGLFDGQLWFFDKSVFVLNISNEEAILFQFVATFASRPRAVRFMAGRAASIDYSYFHDTRFQMFGIDESEVEHIFMVLLLSMENS